jgi:hypothetical protein
MRGQVYRFFGLLLSASILVFLASAGAVPVYAGVNEVTLTAPGFHGEGDDYFTTVWGNPRDMNDTNDLYLPNSSCNPDLPVMWKNTSYSNGIWRGTTKDVGLPGAYWRYLFILNPGWGSSLDTGEDGGLRKIDTQHYTQLSFRMRVQSGTTSTNLDWILWGDGEIGISDLRGSWPFRIQDDGQWHIYTFNLASKGEWTSGPVSSLRFQFDRLSPDKLVEIDWIRLAPQASYQMSWSGTGMAGKTAEIYLGANLADPEQRSKLDIFGADKPWAIPAGYGPLAIPASLPGGTYYARVIVDGSTATSAQAWTIKAAPIAEIVAPSWTSGEDFASTILGNPWDMADADDVDAAETKNLAYAASSGVLDIQSTVNDGGLCDASYNPLALNLGGQAIDTNKFKYFSYRYKVDNAPDQGAGGVSRVHWILTTNWAGGLTDDISFYDSGWNVYKLDLSSVDLEQYEAEWTSFAYNRLKIVANESRRPWTSHLDWVRLTAENTAGTAYQVLWNVDPSRDVLKTTLYWDANQNPDDGFASGGTVVPTQTHTVSSTLPYPVFLPVAHANYGFGASEGEAQFKYTMSMDGLSSGRAYYVAIKLEDGYNVTWWYSELPVRKR